MNKNGELVDGGILFSENDLRTPEESELFRNLKNDPDPEIRNLAEKLYEYATADTTEDFGSLPALLKERLDEADTIVTAAELGDAEAQYNLGVRYHREKNLERAVEWYRKAAAQGNVNAQNAMGTAIDRIKDKTRSGTQGNLNSIESTSSVDNKKGREISGFRNEIFSQNMQPSLTNTENIDNNCHNFLKKQDFSTSAFASGKNNRKSCPYWGNCLLSMALAALFLFFSLLIPVVYSLDIAWIPALFVICTSMVLLYTLPDPGHSSQIILSLLSIISVLWAGSIIFIDLFQIKNIFLPGIVSILCIAVSLIALFIKRRQMGDWDELG